MVGRAGDAIANSTVTFIGAAEVQIGRTLEATGAAFSDVLPLIIKVIAGVVLTFVLAGAKMILMALPCCSRIAWQRGDLEDSVLVHGSVDDDTSDTGSTDGSQVGLSRTVPVPRATAAIGSTATTFTEKKYDGSRKIVHIRDWVRKNRVNNHVKSC